MKGLGLFRHYNYTSFYNELRKLQRCEWNYKNDIHQTIRTGYSYDSEKRFFVRPLTTELNLGLRKTIEYSIMKDLRSKNNYMVCFRNKRNRDERNYQLVYNRYPYLFRNLLNFLNSYTLLFLISLILFPLGIIISIELLNHRYNYNKYIKITDKILKNEHEISIEKSKEIEDWIKNKTLYLKTI